MPIFQKHHTHWQLPVSTIFWLVLTSMGIGQVSLIAVDANTQGGFWFLLPLCLFTLLFTVPLRLAELALGRRSHKGLILGMEFLTREADAPRMYRTWSWLSLFFLSTAFGLACLNTSWNLSLLFHAATTTHRYILDYSISQLHGQIVPGILIALAGCAVLAERNWTSLTPVLRTTAGLSVLCLIFLELKGAHLPHNDRHRLLSGHTWILALKDALLLGAGGFGLWYTAGSHIPDKNRLVSPTVYTLSLELLLVLAFMPILSLNMDQTHSNPLQTLLVLIPRALSFAPLSVGLAWSILAVLSGLIAMSAFIEPLQQVLTDRNSSTRTALFISLVAGLLGTIVLAFPLTDRVISFSAIFSGFLLCIFCGFAMKISHLRKTLQLPNELLYNVWRVLVRIAIPIAIIILLTHFRIL